MWTIPGDSSREEECPKSVIACLACRKVCYPPPPPPAPSPSLSALDFMHLPSEIDKEQQLPSFMHDQGIFSQPEATMQGLDHGIHGNG